MLSHTCKTAVKAVIFLATKDEKAEKTGIKEIAEHIGASEHSLGKMLQTLVRHDVIKSMKGPTGGFYLSKEQRKQPLMDIAEAIDGKNVFKECGLGLSRCSDTHPCPIHHDYKKARDIVNHIFNTKKVADLCSPVNSGMAFLFG